MFAEYTQALLLAEKCGDRAMIATAKMNLISHKTWSSIDEVPPGCYEDAWEDAVASGNKSTLTMILINWSGWHSARGNLTEAEETLNEALSLIDQTEQNLRRPFVFNHLATIKKLQNDFSGAKGLLAETLAWFEKLGIRSELSTALSALAEIAFLEGRYLDAANLCSKVLDEIVETDNKAAFADVVSTCIAVANQAGRDEATVTLSGAFDQLSSQPFWQGLHFDEQTAQLQTVLGDDVYYQLRKAGSKLSHEEIILQARAMLAGVLQSAVAP
jgi:tetratricopeptide (TPR) repeat protein